MTQTDPAAGGVSDSEQELLEEARHFNHHQEPSVEHAYKLYDAMLSRCPVNHSDAFGGFYILNKYTDVRAAAKDWETFSSAQGVFMPRLDEKFPMIESDPPDHTWFRSMLKDEFSVAGVRRFEEPLQRSCVQLVEAFVERGECEIVAELCEPLPVMAICHVVGIEDQFVPTIRPIAINLFAAMKDPSLFMGAFGEFAAFATEQIEMRRARSQDDLLTRLATQEFDGRRLPDDKLIMTLIGMLIAGHHTTSSAMSSVFRHIASDAVVRDRLRKDPRLVRTATEETIRLDSPGHFFFRETTTDVQVGDVTIPAECPVALNWAGANIDPDVFDNPLEFRLDRTPNPHFGFGHGLHTCVGAPLSRSEIRLAVEYVLERLPDIELAVPADSLTYRFVGGNLAVLEELPVRFTPSERRL